MQKKLIALAIAGLASSAAFAQSNVSIYGIVDVGQAVVKSSGGVAAGQSSVGRLDSNSSYIGFKGVEDLGNGLKAVFQIETAVNGDTGGFGAGRDTYVGLAGGFGTVAAGRLTAPFRAMGVKVELMPGAAGFGTTASVTGTIAGLKTGADERSSNAIAYISPSFSGLTGTIAYVNGENKTNATPLVDSVNERQVQAAVQYENGPLFVGGGYHKTYDFASVADFDARVYRLAAVYTLPTETKLTALYDNTKADGNGVTLKRAAWSIAAAQSFGKNTVGLEYARSGDVKTQAGTAQDTAVDMWSAVYTYSLSKRTSLHARYSRLSNDDLAATNFYNNPVANPVAASAGSNVSGYMLGLRHAF